MTIRYRICSTCIAIIFSHCWICAKLQRRQSLCVLCTLGFLFFFSKDDAKKYTNNSVETKLSSSIGFENKECKGGFEIFLSGNTFYMWVQF